MSPRLLVRRLVALVKRREYERELHDEIEAHLELAEREALGRGLSAEESRREARLRFGNIDNLREHHRDRRGLPVVEELSRDVRFSLRSLRRDHRFALLACLVMALAIGSGTAIFSVVDAVVLRALPYDEHESPVL